MSKPPSSPATRSAGTPAWCAVALLLLAPSVLVWLADGGAAALLDWQPALWRDQPWRVWSAAWVHLSPLHLGANLAGGALVLALGWAARVPPRAALAWSLAWPLTHLALLAWPELTHYGGLSGVLHAGTAAVAVTLAKRRARAERRVGWAILAVLAVKLLSEAPWRGALAQPAGWDIAVVPWAHAAGALTGALLAALLVGRGAQPRMRATSAVVE